MAKDIETIVAELADREAIRELPIKYCDCVWRGDTTGIVDLFASDGSFITKGRKREHVASGREGLLKLYGGLTGGAMTPRPYIHNHVLQLEGNGKASGRCYVELRDLQKDFEWAGTGFYEDKYVKSADGWKFQSRTFTTAYMKRMPG
jgi:hypothetical protein